MLHNALRSYPLHPEKDLAKVPSSYLIYPSSSRQGAYKLAFIKDNQYVSEFIELKDGKIRFQGKSYTDLDDLLEKNRLHNNIKNKATI